jgi:uncharacterized protein (DUF1501 family)
MSAMAQGSDGYRALVCIFLFGGNDGNNLIVPTDATGYSEYQSIRKNLALAENSLLPLNSVSYGLHPNLPEIQALFNQGAAAIVANVGVLVQPTTRQTYQNRQVPVPVNLFSHSDQQIQWQSAIPNTLESDSGWGGRSVDAISQGTPKFPTAISISGNSLFLSGRQASPAVVIPGAALGLSSDDGAADAVRNQALQQMLTFSSGLTLVRQESEILKSGISSEQALATALAGAPALVTVFPKTSLGAQLQQVAQIIQVRSNLGAAQQLFFCSLGGFDTHSAQLGTQIALFTELSQSINAFYSATEQLGVAPQGTTFTASDFGRSCQPNSTGGTDHAWGNNQLVVGGSVKGGTLYGTFPELAINTGDDALNRGIWIPSTSLDQYGATLGQWFGVPVNDLATIFPNLGAFAQTNLGFLG